MDGFLAWGKEMNGYMSKVDVQTTHILSSDADGQWKRDGAVDVAVVLSTVNYTVRATGEDFSFPLAQVCKVDLQKGVIKEIRPYYWDVRNFNRKLGLA